MASSKKDTPFELYGIFGDPLSHSLSPAMQEKAFSLSGRKAFYLVLELGSQNFKTAMKKLKALPLEGFNVTIPYKESVMSFLDEISPEAAKIGAVNTVYRRGRRWLGTNTDVYGFLEALKQEGRFQIRGKRALVLGAGGAARAAVYGLAKSGAKEILIFNRHAERARLLAKQFQKLFPGVPLKGSSLENTCLAECLEASDLVVNSTSLGLKPGDPAVLPEKIIPKAYGGRRKLFYDLIYSPAKTTLLRQAEKKGHRTLNGVGMLVYQGARAFECWTGKKAPVFEMREALVQALDERERKQKDRT